VRAAGGRARAGSDARRRRSASCPPRGTTQLIDAARRAANRQAARGAETPKYRFVMRSAMHFALILFRPGDKLLILYRPPLCIGGAQDRILLYANFRVFTYVR
jgi:hypothetical protein